MQRDRQRLCLEQLRDGYPPFSYKPLYAHLHDIFNIQPPLFGPVKPTDWHVIEKSLRKRCRPGNETDANLGVARGLYDWIVENGIKGRKQDFYPLPMGVGGSVSYWLKLILEIEGQPTVPYVDPRRARGLGKDGRHFAFSMMHQRIRVGDVDYADVRFAILKFPNSDDDVRAPVLHFDDGIEPFTRDQLESMVAGTYDLWREVCEERRAEGRRAAAGQKGSLI